MKFVVLIFIVFVSCQNVYSNPVQLQSNFGKFFGACPSMKGVINQVLENPDVEWYTRWVLGNSPWSYIRCPSSKFDFRFSKSVGHPTATTRFTTPVFPVSFEVEGEIKKISTGEYNVNYKSVFGDVTQKLVVLQNLLDGVVVWTCFDFKFFHLESVQLMTKSNNENENINRYVRNNAQYTFQKYGIPFKPFTKVDQTCE